MSVLQRISRQITMGGLRSLIMAQWTARCYLGTKEGYQNLTANAATIQGAKDQFERVYGSQQTINIRRVDDNFYSGGSSMGVIESVSTILFWVGAILVFSYWKEIAAIALIFGILSLIVWFFNQKETK